MDHSSLSLSPSLPRLCFTDAVIRLKADLVVQLLAKRADVMDVLGELRPRCFA